MKVNIDLTQEQYILNLYVDEKMSMKNIGVKVGCCSSIIKRSLIKNKIRIRKRGETFIGVQKNYKTVGYEKGNKPWNKYKKGIHLSTKSEFKKGQTPWNKGLLFNPNKEIRNIIRDKQEFKDWRYKVYKRDKNICQLCGHKSTNKIPINAHHIYRLQDIITDYNITTVKEALSCDVLWNINNGISLCVNCHKKVHREVEVMPLLK